ncbi:MAG: hypothetical protein ACJA1R_003069 [Flavobacteriales bacterium]|jgi:hypothetical protein
MLSRLTTSRVRTSRQMCVLQARGADERSRQFLNGCRPDPSDSRPPLRTTETSLVRHVRWVTSRSSLSFESDYRAHRLPKTFHDPFCIKNASPIGAL